jgi:hypothetical protein
MGIERPTEDPTKKKVSTVETGNEAAHATKQEAAPKAPEISPDEAKRRENQRDTSRALYTISENLAVADKDSGVNWQERKQDWTKATVAAFKETKGSVRVEHENMLEPMAMLAISALTIEGPNTDTEVRHENALARKAFTALMDRYPSQLRQAELIKAKDTGDFRALIRQIGDRIAEPGSYQVYGESLQSMSNDSEYTPFQRLVYIDNLLADLALDMKGAAMDNAAASTNAYNEQRDAQHKAELAKILPHMKALMDLRAIMVKSQFSSDKSPGEVQAIAVARQRLEQADTDGPNEVKPGPDAAKKRGSPIGVEELAEMRARAEAIQAKSGSKETGSARVGGATEKRDIQIDPRIEKLITELESSADTEINKEERSEEVHDRSNGAFLEGWRSAFGDRWKEELRSVIDKIPSARNILSEERKLSGKDPLAEDVLLGLAAERVLASLPDDARKHLEEARMRERKRQMAKRGNGSSSVAVSSQILRRLYKTWVASESK